jgi:hypothetical protein
VPNSPGGVGTLSDRRAKPDPAGAALAAWSVVHGFSLLWLHDAVNGETPGGDPPPPWKASRRFCSRLDSAGWGHSPANGRHPNRTAAESEATRDLRRRFADRSLAGHLRRGLLRQERGGDQRGERKTQGQDEHHRVGVRQVAGHMIHETRLQHLRW